MSEPFIGEIRIFAGNFAIRDWAFCDGALINISQNPALFSILGTTYGGDGRTTFALPDMRSRAPMHWGSGPGLSTRQLGQKSGAETAALSGSPPLHGHQLSGSENEATSNSPTGQMLAGTEENTYDSQGNPVPMAGTAIAPTGGQAHNNMQPFQVLNFIIALDGIFPSRN